MCFAEVCLRVFHLAFLLGKAQDRRVKKVRIVRGFYMVAELSQL